MAESETMETDADQRQKNHSSSGVAFSRTVLSAVLVCIVIVGYVFYRQLSISAAGPQSSRTRTVTVTATAASESTWSNELEAIGTLEANQGIDVTSSLDGTVASIHFESGNEIDMGELLVELDTSVERAKLKSLEVRLEQARRDEKRQKKLFAKNVVTKSELEDVVERVKNLDALRQEQVSVIDKKTIEAPFEGVLGICQVDVGQYVSPGDMVVTLQDLDPMHVNFDLAEQHFGQVEQGQSISFRVDAYPGRNFEGKIIAMNPLVNERTRKFTVQASVPNEEQKLQPGMFAEVTVNLPGERQAVTLPVTAISFHAYGESVFFVRETEDQSPQKAKEGAKPDHKQNRTFRQWFDWLSFRGDNQLDDNPSTEAQNPQAPGLVARRAFVETGQRRDLKIEILKGVDAGERVVTAGQHKLEDGSPISLSEKDVLEQANPRPTEP